MALNPSSGLIRSRSGGMRRGGVLKKLLLIGTGTVLGLLLLAALLVPLVAGGIVRSKLAETVNAEIDGSVRIDSISLSWWGEQRARGVELLDPDGNVVANANVTVHRGLLGLIGSPLDLGRVEVSGWVEVEQSNERAETNLQRAIETGPSASPPRPAGQARAVKLPPVRMNLDLRDLRLGYTVGGERVGVSGLTVRGPLAVAGPTDLTIAAVPTLNGTDASGRVINGGLRARSIVNSANELSLSGSGLELTMDANLPREWVEIVAGLTGEGGTRTLGAGRGVRVEVGIREEAGRLVSSRAGDAVVVSGPIPAALIAGLGPEGSLAIGGDAGFTVRTTRLNLPVAVIDRGVGRADLRGGSLLLALRTDAVDGRITGQGGEVTTLRVEPIDLVVGSEDFSTRAVAQGNMRAMVNGTPAGTALLDVQVNQLLRADGTLAEASAMRPRGELKLSDAPATLLDPLAARVEGLGGDGFVRDVFGETVSLTLTAEARADLGSDDVALESPAIWLEMDSSRTSLRANGVLDGDRIEAPGEALVIESSAGREVLRRFAPDLLAAMEDDGGPVRLVVRGEGIRVIQGRDTPVDLDRVDGSVRVRLERVSPATDGFDRMAMTLSARQGARTQFGLVGTGRSEGEEFSINADLALGGLARLLDADGDLLLVEGVTTDGDVVVEGMALSVIERVLELEPGTLADAIGRRVSGSVRLASADGTNSMAIGMRSDAAELNGRFTLDGAMLRSTDDLRASVSDVGGLMQRLDATAIRVDDREVLRVLEPRSIEAFASELALDLRRLDDASAVAAGIGRIGLRAPGLGLVDETGRTIRAEEFTADVRAQNGSLRAEVRAASGGRSIMEADAELSLQRVLDGAEMVVLLEEMQRSLRLSAEVPAWVGAALSGEQEELVTAALSEGPVRLSVEPSVSGSAVRLEAAGSRLDTTARLEGQSLRIGEVVGSVLVSNDSMRRLLIVIAEDGEALGYGLRSDVVLDVRVSVISIPLGEEIDFSGVSATAQLRESAVVTGAIETEAGLRDLGVRELRALVAMGSEGPTIEVSGRAFDPDREGAPLGMLMAGLEPGGRFDVRLTDGRPRAVDEWLAGGSAPGGALAMTFGDRLDARARGIEMLGLPEGTDRIEVTVTSTLLNTSLLANRSAERIELAESFQAAWTLAPAVFDQLIGPVLADTEGSSLRLCEPARAAVSVREFTIERRDGVFAPGSARIDGEFGMINANFDAVLGEPGPDRVVRPIALGKLQGSVRRDEAGDGPIRFELVSRSDDLDETLFRVDGTFAAGADASAPRRLTASANGDVPTALIDVLAGQRGLIVATIGDSVRIEAQADGVDAARTGGRITASAQARRAEAAAFGRFEDGTLVLGDGAASRTNITLSEITPEVSARVFEPLFPLLRSFEKSRGQAPTMVTVTSAGLRVPTDGDLSKLNGNINLNLGTVRFEAGDLLAAVLSATANRTAGDLGETIPPVLVRFTNGVASYDQIEIPMGDVKLRTRGSIDLVNQRMDIIVLLPLDFVSSDLRRAAERVPLLREAAVLPMRARGDIGRARLEIDPSALGDALPRALEDSLNELINRGLRDLFR